MAFATDKPAGTRGIPLYGVVLFAALTLCWGIFGLTRGVEHLGGDQHLNLLLVLKGEDGSLFSRDLVFEGRDLTGEYIPLYIGFLRLAFRLTGDLAAGYKALVFAVTLLYLCGAYFVFRWFSGRPEAAVALALVSSFPVSVILADEFFGVGPVGWMVARTIVTGAMPLLVLAFFAWIDRPWRLVLVCAGVGALANAHPVSALYLAAMLGMTYLLEMRPTLRSAANVIGMGCATLAGAAPIVAAQLRHVLEKTAAPEEYPAALVAQIAKAHLEYVMYPPRTLAMLPPPLVDALTLGLVAASVVLVARRRRDAGATGGRWPLLIGAMTVGYLLFPEARLLWAALVVLACLPRGDASARRERLGVFFAVSIFWITVAELLVFQFGPGVAHRPMFSVVLTRGARFAVFALFILMALAIRAADWSRVRGAARVGIVALLLFTVVWQVRHTVRTYLRTRGDADAAQLAAMARWAGAQTGWDDLFLFDSAAFRVMARRSLAFASKDHGPVIFNRPSRAAAWLEREAALRAAGVDAATLLRLGVQYRAQYVVVPAASARGVEEASVRFANERYAVLATGVSPP